MQLHPRVSGLCAVEDVREQRDREYYHRAFFYIHADPNQDVDVSDARLVGMPRHDGFGNGDVNHGLYIIHLVYFNLRDSRLVLVQGQNDDDDNDDDNDDSSAHYDSTDFDVVIVDHDLRDSREVLGVLG